MALALIIAVAVGLRMASALYQGDRVTILPGIYDQISYHTLAIRVLQGHGFSFGTKWWPETHAGAPTAHWSFLYTLYLAGVYLITGVHPLVARLIQAIVAGIFQPLLTWRIGRSLFGQRIGLIGAGLSSVYIYFFYYGGALMTETFYILAILWTLDLVISLGRSNDAPALDRRRSWLPWLALGLAFGIATLLRQLILLLVPIVFGWLVLVRSKRGLSPPGLVRRFHAARPTTAGLAVSLAVMVILIAPWTVRNFHAFHRFVLLNTNDGYVFFWGNNPVYGTNFVPILPSSEYQQLIPANLKGLDEAALNDELLRRGVGFVIADPVRYARLSVSRIKSYFEFWPSPQSSVASNLSRTFSFGVLLPFMIVGLYLSARDMSSNNGHRREALGLLYLFMVVYTAIHLLSWALVRYRLPIDAILILFAARALDPVLDRFSVVESERPGPGPLNRREGTLVEIRTGEFYAESISVGGKRSVGND